MDDMLRTARRATVGVSALGWVSFLCLLASIFFWAGLFLALLVPPKVISPQTIQAGLMVIAFALVLPLFWSMLLPSSPAGRLLQKQQWATPGYVATTAASFFLTYHAWRWSYIWWQAQPAAATEAVMLSVTTMIAAVLLPALSWCVVTPEQWIAQIEQARHVKRIEHAMRMEEAAMRASYARGVSLLSAGLANLTIEQRKELGGILGGFARAQQDALTAIGESWKEMYGVEQKINTIPDRQLLDQYVKVVDVLADGGDAMGETADYADEVRAIDAPRDAHVSRHVTPAAHVNAQSRSVQTRDAQQGRAGQGTATPHVDPRRAREDHEARLMWERLDRVLPDVVMAKNVQAAMQWQDITPAKRLVARWVDIGILEATGPNRPGRYSRVEG